MRTRAFLAFPSLVIAVSVLLIGISSFDASTQDVGPRVWHRANEQPRPSPRFGFGAAFDIARGTLVLQAGGQYIDTGNETWLRQGTQWSLRPTDPTPSPQYGMGMVYDAERGEMVMFGGFIFGTGGAQTVAETWTWNGTTWHKHDTPVAPSRRVWPAMTYDTTRKKVVLFGGLNVDYVNGSNALGDTWEWDGSIWVQRDTPVAPSPRYLPAIDYDPARKTTVLFGGNLELSPGQWSAETWTWDGNVWTLRSPANSPEPRQAGAFAIDPRTGNGVLFSGSSMFAFPDTWIWDGNNWTKAQPPHLPISRNFSRMVYDSSANELVLLYGNNGNALLRDIWAWTGNDWVERTQPLEPSPRAYGRMCLDESRTEVVLFGGLGCDSILAETWVWNGQQWQQRLPQTSPPQRYDHMLAFDATRGKVVLFGGENAQILGDTWLWDGVNWLQVNPTGTTPTARHAASMAYDPVRKEIVLFGGEDSNGLLLGDTWVWDGTQWSLRLPLALGPTPRFRSAMAWDSTSGQIILFGGFDDLNGTLSDTWAWTGSEWVQLSPANSPAPKYGHGMSTDPADGHAVLFRSPDTWIWDGTNWQQVTSPQTPSPRGGTYFAGDPTGNGVVLFGGPSIGYRDDTWRLAPNTAPVAENQAVVAEQNASLPITLTAVDNDADLLRFAIGSGPFHGSLGGVPPHVTYTPAANFKGPDSFTFTANDGFIDSNVATVTITVAAPAPLNAVVSRKIHGGAGTFDIDLPLNGSPGIECRDGGNTGEYTLIFNFANPLTSVGSVGLTSGRGVLGSKAIGNDPHQYIVHLTGVANAQFITVALTNVSDSAGNHSNTLQVTMGLLIGDVTGNKIVSNTDVASVKAQIAAPVTSSNFRNDVNANGVISNTDVSNTKVQVGTSLP